LLGKGDGSFQAPSLFAAGNSPRAVVAGDFNGDGISDLAVANPNSSKVTVLLGNGDGTFQAPVGYVAGTSPVSLATGDLNGDNFPAIAVANNVTNGRVSVLLNAGDGPVAPQTGINRLPGLTAVGGDGRAVRPGSERPPHRPESATSPMGPGSVVVNR